MKSFPTLIKSKPLIGMLHLGALPGSPRYEHNLDQVIAAAVADAKCLESSGFDALMLENFGDVPFFPGTVPAVVIAAMTRVATEVSQAVRLPLGINVLRNDARSALAIAHAVSASFIRVNVLTGARVTDQGVIQGEAHALLRERAQLGAFGIAILADADVKHSAPLAPRALEDEVKDCFSRGLADAAVVSGAGTGLAVDPLKLKAVKGYAGIRPVLVGSGVSAGSLPELWPYADGFIVGTSVKVDGIANNKVDPRRAEALTLARNKLKS